MNTFTVLGRVFIPTTKVSALEEEVKRLDQSVEEKNSAISTSRKHLKNSRERNMVGFTKYDVITMVM